MSLVPTSHTTIGTPSPVGVEDCAADEASAEFSTQNFPWNEKSKAADVAGVCRPTDDGRSQRRRVICSPERAQTSTLQTAEGPAEDAGIRLGFCPLFHSQDRWRDTCSCLNITFPVLCSSSRPPRAPPRAFSVRGPSASEEDEFRREQLFCRDAHIWCCVVSQRQSGRGLGITPEASSSEL